MQESTGVSHPRSLSSAIEPLPEGRLREVALLFGVGVLLAASHMMSRGALHIPGCHGVVDMAILVAARQIMRHPWSATLVSIAAAGFAVIPGTGFGSTAPLFYVLPGLVVDVGYRLAPQWRTSLLFLATLAALGYGMRPLGRWLIAAASDAHFGSLAHGLAYPLFSHLVFGFLGGLVAAWGWRIAHRRGGVLDRIFRR